MFLKVRSSVLGGTALLFIVGAGQALAADPNAIADALVAAMTASDDTTATYQAATASGDDVTITGFTATNGDGGTVTVPTLTITNAQPRDPGGFTADAMAFDGGSVVDEDSNVRWQTGALTDAIVPSPEEIKAKAKVRPFSRVDIGGLSITGSELPAPLEIASVGIGLDVDSNGTPRDFDLSVDSIKVSPEMLAADPQMSAVFGELGYSSGLTINLDVAGGYETEGDILTIRDFTIDSADVGKLAITGKFNGISVSKMAAGADPGDMGAGSLEALTVRFDNAGVVERVLDMQAKMMGVPRDDMVAQLTGGLPFMLNFIGNPGFQEKVAKAGSAFLNDPQSLTITVMPAQPVQFNQIASTAGQAPQTLPDLLAIEVDANN